MTARYAQIVFATPLRNSFSYAVPEGVALSPGMRVVAPFGRQSLTGFVISISDELPPEIQKFPVKTVEKVLDAIPLFNDKGLAMARWLAEMYFCSVGEALSCILPDARQERVGDSLLGDEISPDPQGIVLSEEQSNGIATICEKSLGMFYVYGLTGSGKTEVFLQVAAKTIAEGRTVIYLVPEIALTKQVIVAIETRFVGLTAVLHSRLTQSQRLKEWRRIQRGEAKFVIGARSAVFAPLENLGLIIVDEEHEGSYKSSNTPRYHARQVAMRRCVDENARLLMGSATPSVEAWHLMETGRLQKITLTKRLAGGSVPAIKIVALQGNEHSLSPELVAKIRETHAAGKQSILFLNRRGFAYFYHCRSCNYEMTCKHCSVTMTFHKSRNLLICHYCGSTAKIPQICPQCASLDLGYAGFGTEKVEEDVARLFPDLRIARLDADSTSRKGSLENLIQDFREGRIDLLLGTQMVAKGLNFPGVSLVGIINADTGLHMPDFRAAERTFGLITQVAGRAGRYSHGGEVIIQTFSPQSPVINWAANLDSQKFYRFELEQRKLLRFPPFSRLIRLVFRGKNSDKVLHAAKEFLLLQQKKLGQSAEILGPSECPLAKVNNNWRFQILLNSNNFTNCHRTLSEIMDGYKSPASVYVEIDTDPVSLL